MHNLRLLIFLQELRPFFVGGKFLIGRQYGFRRRHAHPHLQFGLGRPFIVPIVGGTSA